MSWFRRLALPGLAQGAALIDVAPSAARPIGLNTCSKSCAGAASGCQHPEWAKGQPLANQPPRNGIGNGGSFLDPPQYAPRAVSTARKVASMMVRSILSEMFCTYSRS